MGKQKKAGCCGAPAAIKIHRPEGTQIPFSNCEIATVNTLPRNIILKTAAYLGFQVQAAPLLLQQMPAIEDGHFHPEWIQFIDATEIDAQLARETRGFVKRIDTASLAEVVLCGLLAELVIAKCVILDLYRELLPWNDTGRHDGTLAHADRTVAAQTGGDRLFAVECKFHGAAMAAPLVMRHRNSSLRLLI
jgi:hypothetical protein